MAGIDQATRETDRSTRRRVERYFEDKTSRKAPKVKDIIPTEAPESPTFEVKGITLEGVKTLYREAYSYVRL